MAEKNDGAKLAPKVMHSVSEEEVICKRVSFAKCGCIYKTKDGERKCVPAGADISDMCKEDAEHFRSVGAIESKLVEVK